MEGLTRDRSLASLAEANRGNYQLLKDGVKVTVRVGDGQSGGGAAAMGLLIPVTV